MKNDTMFPADSQTSMEDLIFGMLKNQTDTDMILDDIAMEFFSTIRTHQHIDPEIMRSLSLYATFTDINEQNLSVSSDSEPDILDSSYDLIVSSADMIESRLDEYFDLAEDNVKKLLMEEPLSARIKEDLRAQNILTLNPQITEDQIEMLYVRAFRKFDALKKKLQGRIMSLSPVKAYYQGEKAYARLKRERHFLMDDDDLLNALHPHEDPEEVYQSLTYKTYLAVTTGRHYTVLDLGEDDYEEDASYDEEEVIEGFDMLPPAESEEEPEEEEIVLEEDGDLRDLHFEYVMELYSEYTGRRIFDSENDDADGDGHSYWSRYEDEIYTQIMSVMHFHLEDTLKELMEKTPEKLKNLAFQYDIGPADYTNPYAYSSCMPELSYYFELCCENMMDHFGTLKMADVMAAGKMIADSLPEHDESDGDVIDLYQS